MHSNDVTDPLNDGAVFKFVGKNDHSASLDCPVLFDRGGHVDQFEGASVSLRVLSLMRVRGIDDNSENVVGGVWDIITVAQLSVLIASLKDFFFLGLER